MKTLSRYHSVQQIESTLRLQLNQSWQVEVQILFPWRGACEHVISIVYCLVPTVLSTVAFVHNRPFLADPEIVNKSREGRDDEINTCIACNQACLDHAFVGKTASCLVNPR
jgi:hypothetical protein